MKIMDVLKSARRHQCPRKKILCKDDPRNGLIGYFCEGCGKHWSFGVIGMRNQQSSIPDVAMEALRTVRGRTRMAQALSNQPVVVVHSEEMLRTGLDIDL